MAVSTVFARKKEKDGSQKFGVYYRKVCSVTVRHPYPNLKMDESIYLLRDALIFSVIGTNCSHSQVEISDAYCNKTASISHHATLDFQELHLACITHLSISDNNGCNIISDEMVPCPMYLDDIVIFSSIEDEHIYHVRAVLSLLHKSHVTLNV